MCHDVPALRHVVPPAHRMSPMPMDLSHRKKLRRYDEPGHAHFLTFSCFHRLALLSKDRTREWFLSALSAARRKHGFELWAWVIMPEHVHLLLLPRDGCRIGSVLNAVKKTTGTKAINY